MCQKLVYSIFVIMSSNFLVFMFSIFRIIFGRSCYGTTVYIFYYARFQGVGFGWVNDWMACSLS
jgi:hypothetical protein